MHAGRFASLSSAILLITLVLSGCNQAGILEKITPTDDKAAAESDVDLLRTNIDALEKKLDPAIENPHDELVKMAAFFPAHQQPTSIKVVGYHIARVARLNSSSTTVDVSLEYEFSQKWLVADIVTRTKDNASTITAFNINESSDSLEHSNRFTLVGKGYDQYGILGMMALDAAITLYALVLCLNTKMGKKKWYWPILILVGFGVISVNWTTGALNFSVINLHLPPVSMGGGFFTPWILSAWVPVGAIAFLILRQSLIEHPQTIAEPPPVITQ